MVGSPELAAAYAACERLTRSHYENFPVASRLLPAAMRPHIAALYAFARVADDFGDEGDLSDETREALLDDWTRALENALARNEDPASGPPPSTFCLPPSTLGLLPAIVHTIRTRHLPLPLFHDLISAFRQDVRVKRYAAWADLLDYCRRSANPVGRLVLRIAGYDDPRLDRQSDALCTALQLTNFWQDLEPDWQKGRVYVPQDDLRAAGAREEDLGVRRLTPEWRRALQAVSVRTRALFDEGRGIGDTVRGRLRWELRLTWLGGVRILDRLEAQGFDVFRQRPTLGASDAPRMLWNLVSW